MANQEDQYNAQTQLAAQQGIERITDATVAAQKAGAEGRSRLFALMNTAVKKKMSQRIGDETVGTTKASKLARLMGKPQLANFLDAMFGQYVDPEILRAKQKAQKKAAKEYKKRMEAMEKGEVYDPDKKEKKEKRGESGVTDTQTYSLMTASYNYLRKIDDSIVDIADDVSDIKDLIKPRKITVRGKPITDDWGRSDDKDTGKIRFAHYNPLAPASAQFVESKKHHPKGWGANLYTHGDPTSKPLGKGFMESAIKQASMQTAIVMLKMDKKEKQRAEIRKKREDYKTQHGFKDPKEIDPLVPETPLQLFRKETNENFEKLFKILDNKDPKGKGVFKTIIKWGAAAAAAASAATVAAAVAGGLTTAAIIYFIDKGMKKGANKSIDQVLTGVSIRIQKSELSNRKKLTEDQKYDQYYEDMALAYANEPNAQAYKRQQWLTSEGLTPEERKMAQRFFDEIDGKIDRKGNLTPVGKAFGTTPPAAATPAPAAAKPPKVPLGNRIKNAVNKFAHTNNKPAPFPQTAGRGEITRAGMPSIPAVNNTGSLDKELSKDTSTGISPLGYAFLDMIGKPESQDRYNAIVGDGKYGGPAAITNFGDHPRAKGVRVDGSGNWLNANGHVGKPSTAAGRYQITAQTWDELVHKYGYKNFMPVTQDLAAWNLAKDRYSKATNGKSLEEALQNGNLSSVAKALKSTWTSLAGGKEQQRTGGSVPEMKQRFDEAFKRRNSGAATLPGRGMNSQPTSNSGNGAGSQVVAPIVVNKTSNTMMPPSRPLTSGSALSNDKSFIRSGVRDSHHPVNL